MEDLFRDETVATMVHDMRAPMTVLKGNLLMLLSGVVGQMSGDQALLVKRSIGPLEDLIQLTENLLQAVNLDKEAVPLQVSETDLDRMLTDVIEFYQLPFKQRRMEFGREGNSFGTKLMVDSFWLKRVLHNLVWNAYKFTPDGGAVCFQVEHKDGGLQISVVDTGRGIPEDRIDSIFEKFVQASPTTDRRHGSGLGLWICRRVMELHGGRIHAESSVGHGSRFVLHFPPQAVR